MLNCTIIPSALLYAILSKLVYQDFRTVQDTVGSYGLYAISSFADRKTDTEGFIVTNNETCLQMNPLITRVTVVVFRGTETKTFDNIFFNPTDIFTNLDFGKVRVVGDGRSKYKVHGGFHKAYRSVHVQVNAILRRYSSPDVPVVFTGHSLGGALATIAAYYQTTPSTHLVTFGCPPIGNSKFAEYFYYWPLSRSRHFVMNGDIVADERTSALVAFLRKKGFYRTPSRISLPGVDGFSHELSSYMSMLRMQPI